MSELQRGAVPVIPALFRCYAGFIPLLFSCYSPAILLLFSCYSPAILLLFSCYYGFIPASFFYARALCGALCRTKRPLSSAP